MFQPSASAAASKSRMARSCASVSPAGSAPPALIAEVERTGYTATLPAPTIPDPAPPGSAPDGATDARDLASLRHRLIVSIVLGVPVIALVLLAKQRLQIAERPP